MPTPIKELLSQALHQSQQAFPIIEHIEQVRAAIQGCQEFLIREYGGYHVVDYHSEAKNTFPALAPDPHSHRALRRECRGLVFAPEGILLCRKFHKCFAIDQRRETSLDAIDWSAPLLVLEKLDGTLVSPLLWAGHIVWTTRGGPSPIAQQAADWAIDHPRLMALVEALLTAGWTPLFEWCSRQHPIVLDHPVSRLVLTAIRHQRTGTYLPYAALTLLAAKHDCEAVQAHGQLHSRAEAATFVQKVAEQREGEGFMLQAEDGHLFKVKTRLYHQLHQLLAKSRPEKHAWQMALLGKISPLHNKLPAEQERALLALEETLVGAITTSAAQMDAFVTEARETLQKVHPDAGITATKTLFAKEWVPQWTGHPTSTKLLFRVWHGEDPKALLRDHLEHKLQSESGIKTTREWLGLTAHTMLSLSQTKPQKSSPPTHRTVIIGDVHGCLSELQGLLKDIGYKGNDHLIFVGDLIDHGPQSAGVVDFVCQCRREGGQVTLVQGNHEARLLDEWHRHCFQRREVIPQDHHQMASVPDWAHDITPEGWTLLANAQLFCALPTHNTLVVHAGIPSTRHALPFCATTSAMARNQQRAIAALQYLRYERQRGKQVVGVKTGQEVAGDWYWAQRYDGRLGHVYYGHHPYLQAQPQQWPHATGLDLGCTIGGHLAAAILRSDTPAVEFVTHKAHHTYTQPYDVASWADVRLGLVPMPTLPEDPSMTPER